MAVRAVDERAVPRAAHTSRALILVVAAAICGYVWLFRNTIIDDAFISLKYSAMLVEEGTWGFLPNRVANTATSPLNVMLTALVGAVTGSLVGAILYLAAIQLLVSCLLLVRISRALFGDSSFGVIATIGLAGNALLMSTIGLEGMLFTTLVIWAVDLYVSRRWMWLAAALALVALTRPDGALLFGLFLLAVPDPRRRWWRFAAVYAAVLTPWLLYSWIALGSFVPDTLQIKVGQQGWGGGLTYLTGLPFYARRFPVELASTFGLLPFAVFAWGSGRPLVSRVATILAAYAVLHLGAYWTLGVPPYHWYYVNQAVPTVLVGSLGAAALLQRRTFAAPAARAALATLAAVPAMLLVVSCLRAGLPLREAPMHTNWATKEEYRQAGEWMKANVPPDAVVFNVSEMGTVSFFSNRLLVNEFSDRNITYRAVLERYPHVPRPVQIALDLNFYWRRMQEPLPPRSYTLIHLPLPNDEEEGFRSRIVQAWDTGTKWAPRARLYLLRDERGGTRP